MTAPTPDGAELHLHDGPTCLCRWCHRARRIECLTESGESHSDHKVPECPASTPPAMGARATCRTCQRDIVYEVVEERGHLPRTGWSDGFPRDALVCFRAIDYRHLPTSAG